jgi:hypothetical protein
VRSNLTKLLTAPSNTVAISPPVPTRVDLLCIDELGYMELDRRGAELLLQVLTEREEKASVAIASNEAFSGWTKTFADPWLCAAIVDRLAFGGNFIETGTDSTGSPKPALAPSKRPAHRFEPDDRSSRRGGRMDTGELATCCRWSSVSVKTSSAALARPSTANSMQFCAPTMSPGAPAG